MHCLEFFFKTCTIGNNVGDHHALQGTLVIYEVFCYITYAESATVCKLKSLKVDLKIEFIIENHTYSSF